MLTMGPSDDFDTSRGEQLGEEEEAGLSYTELQPVIDLPGCLITSSTDPCLHDFENDVMYVELTVQTDNILTELNGCPVYTLPDSPESLVEVEEEQGLELQTTLYEESRVFDDEDDDASIMLDFMDLSFLDIEDSYWPEDVDEGQTGQGGYTGHTACEGHTGHGGRDGQVSDCFTDRLDNCPTVIVTTVEDTSDFRRFTPSPSPSPPTPSPSPPPATGQSPPIPITPVSTVTTSDPETTFTLHYCDLSTPIMVKDVPNRPRPLCQPDRASVVARRVRGPPGGRGGEREEEAMDFDSFDNSGDEDDEEKDYKPYCDSRRGAKKNLLWKFLLWALDHHSSAVRWTDERQGIFKFLDTARISTLWGQRKNKKDMTFEKLSRGIRHYYRRGLMERLPHTRLMYKINWNMVPKRYRKVW